MAQAIFTTVLNTTAPLPLKDRQYLSDLQEGTQPICCQYPKGRVHNRSLWYLI